MKQITHPVSTEFLKGITTTNIFTDDAQITITEKGLRVLEQTKKKRPYTKRSRYWRTTFWQRCKAAIKAFRTGR